MRNTRFGLHNREPDRCRRDTPHDAGVSPMWLDFVAVVVALAFGALIFAPRRRP